MNKIVLLIHGIGTFDAANLQAKVARLERDVLRYQPQLAGEVYFGGILYSTLLQENQTRLYGSLRKRPLRWLLPRQFTLYYFGDAVSLEHRAHLPNSLYEKVQEIIYRAIQNAYSQPGMSPRARVIIVAESLGGHLISNYLWDAQAISPNERGIWMPRHPMCDVYDLEEKRLRLRYLRQLITVGCNIPLFVSGKPTIQGIYNQSRGYSFEWHNIYDKDDLLGWPLQPMGDFYDPSRLGTSYAELVQDQQMNATGGFLPTLLASWNPLAHLYYLRSPQIIQAIAQKIAQVA